MRVTAVRRITSARASEQALQAETNAVQLEHLRVAAAPQARRDAVDSLAAACCAFASARSPHFSLPNRHLLCVWAARQGGWRWAWRRQPTFASTAGRKAYAAGPAACGSRCTGGGSCSQRQLGAIAPHSGRAGASGGLPLIGRVRGCGSCCWRAARSRSWCAVCAARTGGRALVRRGRVQGFTRAPYRTCLRVGGGAGAPSSLGRTGDVPANFGAARVPASGWVGHAGGGCGRR